MDLNQLEVLVAVAQVLVGHRVVERHVVGLGDRPGAAVAGQARGPVAVVAPLEVDPERPVAVAQERVVVDALQAEGLVGEPRRPGLEAGVQVEEVLLAVGDGGVGRGDEDQREKRGEDRGDEGASHVPSFW